MSDMRFRPYVPVAERRARASREAARLRRSGRELQPVQLEGRTIARTFWGKAWCDNLEAYSDYANRLPRGRTYARSGSVIDLKVERGRVDALVYGSELYDTRLHIDLLSAERWQAIRRDCAGHIHSVVELLQGKLSDGVMDVVTRSGDGLFPTPPEIHLDCSCPDWADMCKHVAAALYGVGARLDVEPELLFTLRGVDPAEMIADAVSGASRRPPPRRPVLDDDVLSSVFGVDIEVGAVPPDDEPSTVAAPVAAAVEDEDAGGVAADVIQFYRASIAGTFYQPLSETASGRRRRPASTSGWTRRFLYLLDGVSGLAEQGEYASARACYARLFSLLDRISAGEDIVHFVGERSAAQVGVSWEDVLPIWAVCVSESTGPTEFADEVVALCEGAALDATSAAFCLEEARFVASDAQRAALDARRRPG